MKNIISVLALIFLIKLFLYDGILWEVEKDKFNLDSYFENPSEQGGITKQFFGQLVSSKDGVIKFRTVSHVIQIYGEMKEPIFGDSAVYLYFDKSGEIYLLSYHNYNYNHFLYFTSVLAFLILIIFFFKDWKIKNWRFKNA